MNHRPSPGVDAGPGSAATALSAAVWTVVVVAAVDPGGLSPYGPLRHGVVVVGVLVLLAAVMARGIVVVAVHPTIALGAVVVLVTLAAAFSEVPLLAALGSAERRLGVIGFVTILLAFVVGQSLPARHVVPVIAGLAGAALVVGGAAVAEWWGWDPPGSGTVDRLSSTLGNPALLGAAVLILLPAALGLAIDGAAATPLRWGGGLAGAAATVALVGSGARAAWIALAVAGLVAAVVRRPAWPARTWGLLTAALAAVVIVGVVAGPVDERLSSFTGGAGGLNGRVDEWRIGWAALVEQPVLGAGPDGYRALFPTVVDEAYVAEHGRAVVTDRAHAGPLDVALAGGVGAGVIWFGWWALIVRGMVVAIRRERPAVVGAAVGVVAYGVGQLGLFPLLELDPIVALVAGSILMRTVEPSSVRTVVTAASTAVVPLAAAAGLALVAVVGVGADRLAADALRAAVAGRSDSVDLAAEANDRRPDVVPYFIVLARAQAGTGTEAGLGAALTTLDAAERRGGRDPAIAVDRGEFSVRLVELVRRDAETDRARRRLARDLDHDPLHPTLWLQAASVEVIGGDLAAALGAWRRAADLAPGSTVPLVEAGRALLAENRLSEAAAWLDEALERRPGDPEARRLADLVAAAQNEGGP